MKKLIGMLSLVAASSVVFAADVSWSYEGETGPNAWVKLAPEFGACSGKNQSPINLTNFIKATLTPLKFNYHPGGFDVLNNGHTIQVNYAAGSTIIVDGVIFELKQFHFHAPSENQINGKSFPLEGHFVHADKDGNLTVVALMFETGATNKPLDQLAAVMPATVGTPTTLATPFSAEQLLPSKRDYYRFNGSLTTPPCSEGVRWIVLKHPVSISKEQIDAIQKVMYHPNNRPLQAVNARMVLE